MLTAFGPDFAAMAAGRLLFGIGAETLNIALTVAVVDYFGGGRLAFAMGLSVAIMRAGSFSADMSPSWFADAYAQGWQPPLVIAMLLAAASLAATCGYWWIDRRRSSGTTAGIAVPRRRLALPDLHGFGTAYWLLLALCVLWYAVIVAFRSTFSIKYFQHARGLELAMAGAMNGYVFLAVRWCRP
jgi:hypothetical protein